MVKEKKKRWEKGKNEVYKKDLKNEINRSIKFKRINSSFDKSWTGVIVKNSSRAYQIYFFYSLASINLCIKNGVHVTVCEMLCKCPCKIRIEIVITLFLDNSILNSQEEIGKSVRSVIQQFGFRNLILD